MSSFRLSFTISEFELANLSVYETSKSKVASTKRDQHLRKKANMPLLWSSVFSQIDFEPLRHVALRVLIITALRKDSHWRHCLR
jgi:hypothetical protein